MVSTTLGSVEEYLNTDYSPDCDAWTYTSEGAVEAKDGVLRTTNPDIEMPLSEVLP